MRTYSYRKQNRDDFARRVRTVDPSQARNLLGQKGKDLTPRRPFVSMIMGFSWFYVVVTIATNREKIESSLTQGSLPAEYHGLIFNSLAALVSVSGLFLLLHVFRLLGKSTPKRSNSKGLLSGAAVAIALIYTPPSVLEAGMGMLDSNSRQILQMASNTVRDSVPGVDFANIALVSSQGR